MPLYEYRCESCDHQFEVIQKFSDAPIDVCPRCSAGPVVKLLSSPAIQFKGSGWYITDYARKDSGASGTTAKASDKSADAKPAASSDTTSSSTSASTPAKSDG